MNRKNIYLSFNFFMILKLSLRHMKVDISFVFCYRLYLKMFKYCLRNIYVTRDSI